MNSPPSPPDPAQSQIASQTEALNQFPFNYDIGQLAAEGGTGTVNGKTYDFTGEGQAQVNAAISQQEAQTLLQISQSTDPAFIQQSLADLQQSDPVGFAARGQLYNQIMASAQNPTDPNAPLSNEVQGQITSLLNQGPTLTTGPNSQTEAIQNAVRSEQVGQGIYLGNAPAAQEAAAIDTAGQQQQATNEAEAQNYISSGVSPQDVQYREIQQALSNLGAFESGASPTTEFGGISGAQQGATPIANAPNNPATVNVNSALLGQNLANTMYAGNVNYAQQNANPFMTGLSLAGGGAKIGTALSGGGYSPTANGFVPIAGSPGSFSNPAADFTDTNYTVPGASGTPTFSEPPTIGTDVAAFDTGIG